MGGNPSHSRCVLFTCENGLKGNLYKVGSWYLGDMKGLPLGDDIRTKKIVCKKS